MAALTAATQRRIRKWGYSVNYNWRVANAVTAYVGSYCMIPGANSLTSTRGYARPITAVQSGIWIGLAIGSPFNLSSTNTIVGDTAAAVVPEVTTEAGPFVLEQGTVTGVSAQTDVRLAVYASNDNDLTLTAPGGGGAESNVVGRVVYWWSSTTCDVLFNGFLADTAV
jgi:hypothetical protein